jgi:hypothetical protein
MNFELTDPEFIRISSLTPYEVRRELQNKSPEWRLNYDKLKRKVRNTAYHTTSKDINNAKRRDKRKVNKPIETIPTIINPDDVDTNIKRPSINLINIEDLNPNTISTYISVIKSIYSKYHNDTLADDAEVLKLLRDEKYEPKRLLKQNMYIVENIKDIALNNPSYLNNLYGIFVRLNGKNLKILRETIYPYSKEYKKIYDENRDKAVVNTELTNKISFDKIDVLQNAEKSRDIYEQLIYLLMFLMPTRRLYDYRITRIATKSGDINHLNYNWYYQGNIYINNTKNKDMMVLELPNEINVVINQLPPYTDYILGKRYGESSLSEKFRNITKHIYGTPFNAVDIRKLYASYNLKTNAETGDTKQMKANARNMGHSLSQNMEYVVKT